MRVATDIGGTFTDLVYVNDEGTISISKAHTTPPYFENGVMDVIEQSDIHKGTMETFIHGTTVIINALTERTGVKTGLITTKGFRDVLEIARGNRPDLFNLTYQKPAPFVERYLRQEVEERLNYKGEELTPLDKEELKDKIAYFKEEQVEAIAVSFLHSYINPSHEQEAVAMIKQMWPEVSVTASYEVTNEWREYERTNTVVLNSYVQPTASSYIDRLSTELKRKEADSHNYIMQSNGGTTTFEQAKKVPINMIESGPVAGVYGAAVLGQIVGEDNIIAFDVGGTTAKCSLISQGEVKITTDHYIEKNEQSAGYPVKIPVVDIIEIGNGGGSIAWTDDTGSLMVGPQSAGADPGPVAYGQGGEKPTTTDASLMTGRLSKENFDFDVNLDEVRDAIRKEVAQHYDISVEEAALGIIRIANSNMLNALRLISVRKGHDPSEFTLVAFGGGGSMHAPALAKELGVKKVIVPVASPVFSAWGMLMTDLRHDYIQTHIKPLHDVDLEQLNVKWEDIESQALAQFSNEGVDHHQVVFDRLVDMRYEGQEHTVKVPVPGEKWTQATLEDINEEFHKLHEKHYTFKLETTPVEIVNLHVTAFGKVEKPGLKKLHPSEKSVHSALKETRQTYFEEAGWLETKVYNRGQMRPGMKVDGPAIVEETSAATVLYPGQSLVVDPYGNLIIDTAVE